MLRNIMSKKLILIILLSISLIFGLSAIYGENIYDQDLTDASDMTGCCSVIMQLEGNDSVVSFRRDAGNFADLTIEEQNWHGQKVLKQYKESQGYFVQVIITSDGWVVTYGGKDDGIDNQRIENISGEMVKDKNISSDGLKEVQEIKSMYRLGHMVIKAPNGDYGVAMSNTYFKGHLNPNEYLSVPNTYAYFRNGTLESDNPTDDTIKLAMSDRFGLTRKNIMTYQYKAIENETFNGSTIDIFASNDDGSMWNLKDASGADNFYYNGTFYDKEDIPIAPDKEYVATHEFEKTRNGNFDLNAVIPPFILIIFGGAYFIYEYLYKKRIE